MTDFVDAHDAFDEALGSKITVTYPSGKSVALGQELTPTEVKDEPKLTWEADPTKYYTLIMYDPDAPSRQDPKFADVKHWLVVNILGNEVSSGEVIAEYIGSAPSQGSGLHRYIFLVFKQKEKLVCDEPKDSKTSLEHRISWSMREFKRKYNLGKVYAGNYYVAQWDSYCDILRKQFEDLFIPFYITIDKKEVTDCRQKLSILVKLLFNPILGSVDLFIVDLKSPLPGRG